MNIGMSTARSARLLGAVGIVLLLAGCEQVPTSPPLRQTIGPIVDGSIIKSNVVTATTVCVTREACKTETQYSEIAEKVGGSSSLRAVMATAIGEPALPRDPRIPVGLLTNLRVSGRTLSADAAKGANRWQVEFTHDTMAKGKLSGVRLALNGHMLLASNAKWTDVGGIAYHERTDLTFYHEGRVVLHQEKRFSPAAVVPGNASIRLTGTLTPRLDYNPHIGYNDDGSCPYELPICDWLQAGQSLEQLENWVGWGTSTTTSIANYFNYLWASPDGEDAIGLADAVVTSIEAVSQPSLENALAAVVSAVSTAFGRAGLEMIGEKILQWLGAFVVTVLSA